MLGARLSVLSSSLLILLGSSILDEELRMKVWPPSFRGGVIGFWAFRISRGVHGSVLLIQKLIVADAVEANVSRRLMLRGIPPRCVRLIGLG